MRDGLSFQRGNFGLCSYHRNWWRLVGIPRQSKHPRESIELKCSDCIVRSDITSAKGLTLEDMELISPLQVLVSDLWQYFLVPIQLELK